MTSVKGTLFVISASSGAGKTSLVDALFKRVGKSHQLERVITYTSRKPRPGEAHGSEYYFLEPQDFEKQKDAGFFIEHSLAYGTYYGSPRSMLEQLSKGISLVVILDIQGALVLKKLYEHVVLIWIAATTIDVLRSRLTCRATDSDEHIDFRLGLAESEMKNGVITAAYDYTIINDDFYRALDDLAAIVSQQLLR
jgi:guanylate kinase